MAIPIPFNSQGIWGIESQGAPTVTATDVTFNFESHPNVNTPYNGLLLVNITTAIPSGTTGTLPIFFKTGNRAAREVTKGSGAPLTVADISGTGYYMFFYNYRTGILRAVTPIV